MPVTQPRETFALSAGKVKSKKVNRRNHSSCDQQHDGLARHVMVAERAETAAEKCLAFTPPEEQAAQSSGEKDAAG